MLQAVGDYALVKLVQPNRATPGGIVLPEAWDNINTGKIVSIGQGNDYKPPCQVDDTILFTYYNDKYVLHQGDDTLILVSMHDIIAVEK